MAKRRANREGTITKRSDGRSQAAAYVYRPDGTRAASATRAVAISSARAAPLRHVRSFGWPFARAALTGQRP